MSASYSEKKDGRRGSKAQFISPIVVLHFSDVLLWHLFFAPGAGGKDFELVNEDAVFLVCNFLLQHHPRVLRFSKKETNSR